MSLSLALQSSTTLWEQLSADVMNQSIKLHHATIRRVLLAHNGYESATEVRSPKAMECSIGIRADPICCHVENDNHASMTHVDAFDVYCNS